MTAFRWGILGAGPLARKFAAGLRATRIPAVVSAVASRDPGNAQRFAAELGARADTYERLIAAGGVDAVYLATPPAVHADQAQACLAAGLPVLVEKPFAPDAATAARIAEAAAQAGVFAMEGMWTRFLPALAEVRARIEAGDLGELHSCSGSFAIADLYSATDGNFDPVTGGALLHRGVYPLSLARHLLGPVVQVSGQLRRSSTSSSVDEDVVAVLQHRSGALSQVHASLVSSARNDLVLLGSRARIELEPPIYRPGGLRLVATPPRARTRTTAAGSGGWRERPAVQAMQQRLIGPKRVLRPPGHRIRTPYAGNGYTHEADAVMDAVRQGRTEHPLMPLAESVQVMELIDRLRGVG